MNSLHGNDGESTRYGNNNLNSCKRNGNHSNVLGFPYEKINTNVCGESGVLHEFELFARINHPWNKYNAYEWVKYWVMWANRDIVRTTRNIGMANRYATHMNYSFDVRTIHERPKFEG